MRDIIFLIIVLVLLGFAGYDLANARWLPFSIDAAILFFAIGSWRPWSRRRGSSRR